VLIYIHKEEALDDVERRYPRSALRPGGHKLRILTTVKNAWRSRVTTVFPRQGQYAHDETFSPHARLPGPDGGRVSATC